ncbi:MAG: hypothetical protein ACRDVP_07480 [Acidimicrobiales bacterium]
MRSLRGMLLGAIILVLCQAGIGMATNLYVVVPTHHPGHHPANYLSGSYDSVTWAIGHGTAVLAIHASLGLALVIAVVGVGVHAFRARHLSITVWTVIGGLLVIGAGFNGSSFLDFNDNASSLIMALLAFGSIACYTVALFVLEGSPSSQSPSNRPEPQQG